LAILVTKTLLCLTANGLLAISIELSEQTSSAYNLQTNGRYQHAETYVRELAKKNRLTLLNYKKVVGRQQENKDTQTGLFIFQKK